jgi:hypothetical protein
MSRANGLIVLTITDDRISTLTRFGGDVVRRFGLPPTLATAHGTPNCGVVTS